MMGMRLFTSAQSRSVGCESSAAFSLLSFPLRQLSAVESAQPSMTPYLIVNSCCLFSCVYADIKTLDSVNVI